METGAYFHVINGPEIMSKLAGESEAKLRQVSYSAMPLNRYMIIGLLSSTSSTVMGVWLSAAPSARLNTALSAQTGSRRSMETRIRAVSRRARDATPAA